MSGPRSRYVPPVQIAVFWVMSVLFAVQMVWWIYYQIHHARDDTRMIQSTLDVERYHAISDLTLRFAPDYEHLRAAIARISVHELTSELFAHTEYASFAAAFDDSGKLAGSWGGGSQVPPTGAYWRFRARDGNVRVHLTDYSDIIMFLRSEHPNLGLFVNDAEGLDIGPAPVSRVRIDDLRVRSEIVAAATSAYQRRVYMFAGEGAFFMVLIFAGVYVIHRALRQSAELQFRQHNFLAAATHELKSPLAAIRLFAETLGRADLSEDKRRELRIRIVENTTRLGGLVDRILEAGRHGRGGYRPNLVPTDFSSDLTDFLVPIRAQCEALGRRMTVAIDDGIRCNTDYHAIRRAVDAICDNAVKYSAVSGEPISVSLRASDGRAILTVTDGGMGFDPRERKRLFEQFYRGGGKSEDVREIGGTGLGLFLVREIVEAHGGRISLVSEGPGRGATATIELPLVRDADVASSHRE